MIDPVLIKTYNEVKKVGGCMKKRFNIKRFIMLMIIISIFGLMLYHVISTRNQLFLMKQDLTDIQNGVITIDEATHIPEGFAYTTPESVHIESAYLWAIPYVITDVVLGALYIVMYKT